MIENEMRYHFPGYGKEQAAPKPGPATEAMLAWAAEVLEEAQSDFDREPDDDQCVAGSLSFGQLRAFLREHGRIPDPPRPCTPRPDAG